MSAPSRLTTGDPTGPATAWQRRLLVAAAALIAVVAACSILIHDPIQARVAIVGGCALVLWLSEIVPPYVTTIALIAAIPLVLGVTHPAYRLGAVLGWAADPVLALFFGGFALGAAASSHGIDAFVAERALALSRHRRRRLLALVMIATAALSMWISNIAAAALMLAALRPHLHRGAATESFRGALLLAVAMGANLGGMATPIGTGPNGIAIAQLEPWLRITFVQWMGFAMPLMLGMLVFSYVLIVRAHRVEGAYQPIDVRVEPLTRRARGLVIVFALAVAAWLTESLHGVAAPLVALGVAAVLFGGGWLRREDLGRIDWSTLLLIAGGIVLGRLVERSGLLEHLARTAGGDGLPLPARFTAFVLVAALMGAVMSNTASAALLIPLALGLGLPRSIAVLIAIGTSFGVPFTISSPPNAMAYGEGGLESGDLLRVGLPLMLVGCLLVGLTGPYVLQWLGLR
ncbi:MAG TPA: DASS family sodium-coupled anion symporter [Candidatus Saccharimonadaceae bacterium]|jgi:sodium-dependent dicarboxylate transporter 2/3/5|nr:DASS family sodium-coupled anion symporter [Candidatus Saccharimonadaceae bacterium]